MHECPFCGQACDCDGEDTWLNAPIDCQCSCGGEDDMDTDNFESEEVSMGIRERTWTSTGYRKRSESLSVNEILFTFGGAFAIPLVIAMIWWLWDRYAER